MGKSIDKAGIGLIALLLAFLFYFKMTHSLAVAFLSAVLTLGILILFMRLIRPKTPRNVLSKRNFIRFILLHGNDALKEIVEKAFRDIPTESLVGHTLIGEKERILIYYAYKFGSLSEEDVAKAYRTAEAHGCEHIYALTNHLDRKALAVTEYIPQKFTVINAAALWHFLLGKGLLPPKESLKRKNGTVLKTVKNALNESNAKYYIWAGLSTALLALFTPITTYYIVFSFINLALALGCVIFSEKNVGKDNLFRP